MDRISLLQAGNFRLIQQNTKVGQLRYETIPVHLPLTILKRLCGELETVVGPHNVGAMHDAEELAKDLAIFYSLL